MFADKKPDLRDMANFEDVSREDIVAAFRLAMIGHFRSHVPGTNINEATLIASDYLNHFHELVMLLEAGVALPEARPHADPPLPIDDSDGGCDDSPQCRTGSPWTRQIGALEIKEGDAITDSTEAFNLMRQRGITNVIVMGVHQNMCVLGRPFSIRQMVRQGQNVVLVRDMTDNMYNSRRKPFVDHFTGNDLVTWHIEKYWCPTITSDQILGGKPFRFSGDAKPPRVFENTSKLSGTVGK